MSFKFSKLSIEDVLHIEPDIHKDSRGFFLETFKASDFKAAGAEHAFVQINHSQSQKNVLRGLHFQKYPNFQGKLIAVVFGAIFDVAVDIRKSSPSYGRWVSATLSAEKKNMLFVPCGFAHGFCVLSDFAEIIYYCTNSEYSPENEESILWNDTDLNIRWPIDNPILSEKDQKASTFQSIRKEMNG